MLHPLVHLVNMTGMPYLELLTDHPCTICGYRERLHLFGQMRVNKHTLKGTDNKNIIVGPSRTCRECGFPNMIDYLPARWALEPKSAEKVLAARTKRGWA